MAESAIQQRIVRAKRVLREEFSRAATLTRNARERDLLLARVAACDRAGGAIN